jgi:hydrogenase nickel incorporation protein HypA/HybF
MLNMVIKQANGKRVKDIHLRVGMMSSIVPESMEVFFDYLSKGTKAEKAKLHFEIKPIEMKCKKCGKLADLSKWKNNRPNIIMINAINLGCDCGSKNLRVTNGVGFELVSINVE